MKKKLVAIATMISLLFTFNIVANAEETPLTYGETLFELGLIKGSDNGLNEEGYLTRAEMITILNRLDRTDSTGFTTPATPTFSDVPATSWAYPEVEKAFHNKLTTGLGDGKFGISDKVTYQQAVTFLMRIAGYEPNYATALDEGAEVGILLWQDKAAADFLLRADVFELMAETLIAYAAGTEDMLIELLPIDEEKIAAFLDQYMTAYNPTEPAFTYTLPVKYTGSVSNLKEASEKQQRYTADVNNLVQLFKGLGTEVSFESFFKQAAKNEATITFNFDWAVYGNGLYGEYGIWGSSYGDLDADGYLFVDVEATEGNTYYDAFEPYVEHYGKAAVDGRTVDLYFVELEQPSYDDEEEITYLQLLLLVDDKGVYKAANSGGIGDGVYTRP